MAPKRASASPSPAARRSTPRSNAGAAPKRLGDDAAFYDTKATAFKSPAPPPPLSFKDELEGTKPSGFSVVGPSDVLVLGSAVAAFAYVLPAPVPMVMPPMVPAFAVMLAVIASSHILYAVVWYKTKLFKKACKMLPLKLLAKQPVGVFGKLVLLNKVVQQAALCAWASELSFPALKALVMAQSPMVMGAAAALVVVGQVLNAAIYKAIGQDGVYYGFKLGKSVKWSSAFPFSAGFRHPQYVGAFTAQLGVLLLLASKATLAAGLVPLAGWWGLCYVLTSLVEASGDND